MITQILAAMLLLYPPGARACVTKGKTASVEEIANFDKKAPQRKPSNTVIPNFAEGNPARGFEARLANWLLANPAGNKTILSIPTSMKKSAYNPFGDGQTNAKMDFLPNWREKGFPAVGIQSVDAEGKLKRDYQFHSSLEISQYVEVALDDGWYEVRPHGWKTSFYFHFDPSILKVEKLLEGIPVGLRTFAGGRPAPNPAKISAGTAYADLRSKNLGEGYNSQPWYESSVHGRFPTKEGEYTAVGGVLTWGIVDQKFGPFKHLYTCFEARRLKDETEKGAPSGAGWHHIGDPAETILNTLEVNPIPIAVARAHKLQHSAYGLSHTITATWLNPDEAAITRKGEFHWYAMPYEKEVCAEVWVHNCVPDPVNHWGFKCN